jgi:L-threonylcarbamoyladenylate synthase
MLNTKVIQINPENFKKEALSEAINLISTEQVVAFPTETVYGLGASAFSEKAVKRIFEAKGRPADNPLIVHISHIEMLLDLVLNLNKISDLPENIFQLCNKFWPGPLTILFQKSKKVPDIVTAGLSTVAIRMPSNKIALALIKHSGVPIAAPSANASGRPSPTTANHVKQDLEGKVSLIIDGGPCQIGVESTVIDLFRAPPMILRPGGINYEDLQEVLPNIEIYNKAKMSDPTLESRPSTPGLKYTHYSPKAPVILLEGSLKLMDTEIVRIIQEECSRDNTIKIGIVDTHAGSTLSNITKFQENLIKISLTSPNYLDSVSYNPAEVAQGLFASLRSLDDQHVQLIIVEGISEEKEGLAVMNRLRKAASKIIKL